MAEKLTAVIKDLSVDCVIANAENAAGGSGITPQIYDKMLKYGVNIVTLGDHAFRKKEIIPALERSINITRPANLSTQAAGKDFAIYKTAKGPVIAVITLIGRIFMKPADCPYAKIDSILTSVSRQADVIFVEMHAEATSEKIAMGHYLDGKVSCVFGTHTHVATADERILNRSTAYITDIGMTGSHLSVLGRNRESVIKSFRTQMPFPFDIATEDVRMDCVLVTVDSNTKKAHNIQRIQVLDDTSDGLSYDSDDGKPEFYNGLQ